jgi:hypothetical protein
MTDEEILKEYGWIVGSSDNMKSFEKALQKARQNEKGRIIGLLEELKIDDAFHERWNDKTSDGEDVLSNTIEMIIGEIKKAKT